MTDQEERTEEKWAHADCPNNAYKPVTCDRCGRSYVCTPSEDFYCAAEGDHCCEPCLIGNLPLRVLALSDASPSHNGGER